MSSKIIPNFILKRFGIEENVMKKLLDFKKTVFMENFVKNQKAVSMLKFYFFEIVKHIILKFTSFSYPENINIKKILSQIINLILLFMISKINVNLINNFFKYIITHTLINIYTFQCKD